MAMPKKMEFDETSVGDALERFGSQWADLPEESRILAEKITMLVAYAGGRKMAAKAMAVGGTTVDNYRAGKTQPKFLEMLKLAQAARHDFAYLVAGTSFQEWASKSIWELRPHDADSLNYDDIEEEAKDAKPLGQLQDQAKPQEPQSALTIDPTLVERLYKAVDRACRDMGQHPAGHIIANEATKLLNELITRVTNLDDRTIVDAAIPALAGELAERLAAAEPGSGKRSAS